MIDWFNSAVASDTTVIFVADAIAKATLLLVLATLAAAASRHASAAFRHRLWTLTLCSLLTVPVFSWIIPGWRIPLWSALTAVAEPPSVMNERPTISTRDETRAEVAEAAEIEETAPTTVAETAAKREQLADKSAVPIFAAQTLPTQTVKETGMSTGATDAAWTVGSWLYSVWMVGFLLAAFPMLLGLIANERRRVQSQSVSESDWNQLIEALCSKLGIRRRVDVRESPESIIPLTWGAVRPVIVLPTEARNWPDSLRRLVLLHELAHIQRLDVGVQLVGRLAAACYWFHPLAWYALHRLRVECEYACDDRVVLCGERPTEYARQLLELARSLRTPRFVAAVGMARRNALDNRFQALFDDTRSHLPLTARTSGLLLALATGLAIALAAVHSGIAAAEPQAPVKPSSSKPATPPAEKKPEIAPEKVPDPMSNVHPITVSGRALDPAGKPIAGARIYLGSCWADWKRVAETTTDTAGRYLFEKVDLPIERKNTNNGRDVGSFEVFGQAAGFGFAWRPRATFFPVPRSESDLDQKFVTILDPRDRFAADDESDLDLTFSAPSKLSGRIVDDRGNPIPETRLAIRFCEPLDAVPGRHALAFTALNETATVPAEMKLRTSDADGRFEFTGLPIDCRFRIDVRPPKFPDRQVWGATTMEAQPDYQGSPVHIGELHLTFVTPLDIPIQVLLGDSDEPAEKAFVGGRNSQNGSHQVTDAQGHATLRLPPGEYRLSLMPAFGTPFLPTRDKRELDQPFVVRDLPPAEPVVMRLRPAAILEVTVVDQTTGQGLPNVDLWRVVAPPALPGRPPHRDLIVVSSYEAETRIVHRDRPRTDVQGKMRVFVEPGVHTIGVGLESYPESHFVVEPDGKAVDCAAGEIVHVRFAMQNFDSQSGVSVLDRLTAVNFVNTPLEDALRQLARRHKLTLEVDKELLGAAGVSRTGVGATLKLRGVPLRSILKDLLEPIQLDCVIDDDRLVITTPENAAARRKVIENTDQPREAPKGAAATSPQTTVDAHPITVTGRVLDPTGKPVAGAQVYLNSCWGERKRMAETMADAAGHYAFKDVPLPIVREKFTGGSDRGAFEVFGRAAKYGFTWRPMKWLYLRPSLASVNFGPPLDAPDRFEPDDKIELDLKLAPPARISGTVMNISGEPLGGTRVTINYCEPIAALRMKTGLELSSINQRDSIPKELKDRMTDGAGKFEFDGLPAGCRFQIQVLPRGMASRRMFFATINEPQPDYMGEIVLTGQLNLKFPAPRDVPVRVLLGDDELPAAGALVSGRSSGESALATADAEGRAVLRLPPGRLDLRVHPKKDIDFLLTPDTFVIGEESEMEPRTIRLRPASILEVTVVDADTGEGIQNVELWEGSLKPRGLEGRASRSQISVGFWDPGIQQTSTVVPRTNGHGRIRALLEPSMRRVGAIMPQAATHDPVDPDGLVVDCLPGHTLQLKIKMRKRAEERLEAQPTLIEEPGLKNVKKGEAARVRKALDTPTEVDFENLDLADALHYLSDFHKIPLCYDNAALAAAGISIPNASPVTLKHRGVSLRSVLQLMLEPARLDYVVDDANGLVITPRDKAVGQKVDDRNPTNINGAPK